MKITPELLVRAYAIGVFPMAESRTSELFWVDPDSRGVIPLDRFHASRSLRRTIRRGVYQVTVDRDFDAVIDACAETADDRPETWINGEIARLCKALHRLGRAHSVETRRDGELVGGLYGVRLGGAFFGESMFSRADDASKVALVHLVARLRAGGFRLLDTQFMTDHLARFGAVEISRAEYHAQLEVAIESPADFHALPPDADAETVLQLSSQTS